VRRCALYLQLIALTLAVALGALLVGLSVAPNALPGNTVRIQPRDLTGALLRVAIPHAHPTPTGLDEPAQPQPPWLPPVSAFLLALSLGSAGICRPTLTPVGRAPLADFTRGPPPLR
jgi:hypothetical protein